MVYTKNRKHPFALAEVFVAIILVGLAMTYIFSAIREATLQYSTLRDTVRTNDLADEHLARSVAQLVINPPDFETLTNTSEASMMDGPYEIRLQTTLHTQPNKKQEAKEQILKAPVALVLATVTVQRPNSLAPPAFRSTLLCVVKEGT